MQFMQTQLSDEQAALTALFTALLDNEDKQPVVETIQKEDLDRSTVEETDVDRLQSALTTKKLTALATISADINEESRLRRDLSIVRAGHKRLMFSAIKTTHSKNAHVEAEISRLAKGTK